MSGIHHFVPVLHRGDAVGRHTLRLREATRARGFPSEIFVDTVDDDTADETVPVLSYPETAEPGDVLVYQFATASAMAPWLAGRSETLVVNYHNVTPPELMAPWDNHLALGQLRAQGDVRLLAPRTALAVADSRYNEAHLTASGFTRTAVVSPSAALSSAGTTAADAEPPPGVGAPRRGARWLAIGRVSPNKGLESTIAALAVARAHGDPDATLRLIGKPATDSYVAALQRYVAELGLGAAVQFAGHASDATVAAAYAGADVLVVTSEHEGFCVPVVEAMAAGVPVVAFDQGAVPEVLGGAGVLVSDKDPYALASAIAALLRDTPRRDAVIAAGRERLAVLESAVRRRPLRRPAGPSRNARRAPRRERHPPVRPDAAPRRRGRAAHAAPARRHGGARHPLAHLRGDGRPRDGSRDPSLRPLRRRGRKPGTCWSISSPRPRRSVPGWAPGPKSWS